MADFCINFHKDDSSRAFYLNVCVSIELLLKNLVVFEEYKKIKDSVDEIEYQQFVESVKKRLASYNHKLTELFNFDSSLRKAIGLKSIDRVINEFTNHFQIQLIDCVVLVPTLEAVRYTVFAGNQQVAEVSDFDNVKKLIKEIKQYINLVVNY